MEYEFELESAGKSLGRFATGLAAAKQRGDVADVREWIRLCREQMGHADRALDGLERELRKAQG